MPLPPRLTDDVPAHILVPPPSPWTHSALAMSGSIDSITTDSRTAVGDLSITMTLTSPVSPGFAPGIGLKASGDDDELAKAPGLPYSADCPPKATFSKTFMDREDPEVSLARSIYLKAYLSGVGMVVLSIFIVFSIYWGALWKVPVHPLQGWIVDFDGAEVGNNIVRGLSTATRGRIIKWDVVPAEMFPTGANGVIDALKDDKVWVAVVVNENATLNLQNALTIPDPSYDGSNTISAYAVEARNENAYRNLIRPMLLTSLDAITHQYSTQLASRLPSLSADIPGLLTTSPQTVVRPVGYRIVNLVPFDQPVASAVVFVGLIYMLILSFFIVMIAHGAREASRLSQILSLKSLIVLRLGSAMCGYFVLSFFYSLLNLLFKLDVSRRYGAAGFLLFWMLNWVGMLSVGLALESMITILTARYIPFFMILWIIVNVSVCIFPIDVLPGVYHYGYAVPFYNISRSMRSIVFGTRNTLGHNFTVLLIWVAFSCVTLSALQWFVRWRDGGERQRQVKAREMQQQVRGQEKQCDERSIPTAPSMGGDPYGTLPAPSSTTFDEKRMAMSHSDAESRFDSVLDLK